MVRSDRRSWLWPLALVAASLAVLHAPAVPAAATERLALAPRADATVDEDDPKSNFGADEELASETSPDMEAYLRFDVPSLAGPVRRATLRLFVTDSADRAPMARATSPDWDERTLVWSNRPKAGRVVAELDRVSFRRWAEYDVTSAVAGGGRLAFVLISRSSDDAEFSSREASRERRPQLVVETQRSGTTSSTTTTTTRRPITTTTTTRRPITTTTTTGPPTTTTTTRPAPPPPGPGTACRSTWGTVEQVADLPAGVTEVSGLVASSAYPGWGWMIRDSGNSASLYALRLDGRVVTVTEFPVPGADNRDWEDVAYTTGANGRGVLWIVDNMGNEWSGNRRIYRVEEPDPRGGGPARLLGTYEIAYPDRQWNTEILFGFGGQLVLITKTSPRMYRFAGPLTAEEVNVPEFVGALPEVSWPTLGGLSPDRRFLVVANYNSLWVFENRGAASDLRSLIARPPASKQMIRDDREGGAFFPAGSCHFLMTAESGNVWRLANGG
jgi:hypothetical protein